MFVPISPKCGHLGQWEKKNHWTVSGAVAVQVHTETKALPFFPPPTARLQNHAASPSVLVSHIPCQETPRVLKSLINNWSVSHAAVILPIPTECTTYDQTSRSNPQRVSSHSDTVTGVKAESKKGFMTIVLQSWKDKNTLVSHQSDWILQRWWII